MKNITNPQIAALAILRWAELRFWALSGFVKSIQRAPPRNAKKQAKANVPKLNGAAIRIIVANDRHIAVIKPLNVFQIIGCIA